MHKKMIMELVTVETHLINFTNLRPPIAAAIRECGEGNKIDQRAQSLNSAEGQG